MDMQMLATDLEVVLEKLPPSFVMGVLHAVTTNLPALAAEVPKMVPLVMPHISAGMVEKTAGLLDMNELMQACMPVLQAYMVKHGSPAG